MSLFAIHLDVNGSGLIFEEIKDFSKWASDNIEGVRPDCQPKFVSAIPDGWCGGMGDTNEYVLIQGKIVLPKATQVVTQYELPSER